MTTISKRIRQRLDDVANASNTTSSVAFEEAAFAGLQTVSHERLRSVVSLLLDAPAADWLHDTATASIWVQLVRRQQTDPIALNPSRVSDLEQIYANLTPRPALQALVLRWLACSRNSTAHETFARLMVEQPLVDPRLLIEVFGDLVARAEDGTAAVFPGLLEGIQHRQQAGFVLDFANHLYRQGLVETHPAASITDQLAQLLSGIATRLGAMQESRPTSQEQVAELGRQVTESVSLGVSLCDALGLIGDADAVGALNKTLAVDHRRLRVEAAAALARMQHSDGSKVLLAMAAEPAERIRVLAYAEELDLSAQVPEEFASHVARAEAAFVMHLSQPTVFGLPPQHIELVAEKSQHWPGYEEPRNCYLFQYVYQFPAGEFTNIGIAGPVVFSLNADLTALAQDDIFSLFAGWHVQHPEIYTIDAAQAVGQDQIDLQRLVTHLRTAEEYSHVVPAVFGHFLGQRVLIASAQRGTNDGWATVSEDSLTWLSAGNPQQPLGAEEAFQLFVGRALLSSFN